MLQKIILCVDDDVMVLRALRSLLGNLNPKRKVLIAESGEEALEVIKSLDFNTFELAVVIADCIMPGMRGDDLLIKIHQDHPSTVKIMLTGQSDFGCVKNAINNANLFRYLEKPFDNDDILLTIKNCVQVYAEKMETSGENKRLKGRIDELEKLMEQFSGKFFN